MVYRLGAVVLEGGGRERGESSKGWKRKKRGAEGFGGEVTSPFIKVSNAKCVAAERCFEPEVFLLTLLVSVFLRALGSDF